MKNLSRLPVPVLLTVVFSFVLRACSPVVYAPAPRPRPVVVVAPPPPPVEQVIVPVVPVWAPPYAYVTEVHYYYFPDYAVYYNVFAQRYIYYDGYSWVNVSMLPAMPMYYGFDPYRTHIVVLN